MLSDKLQDLSESERSLLVSWWHRTIAGNVLNEALRDKDTTLNSPECAAATVEKFRDMGFIRRDPHRLTGLGFAMATRIKRLRKDT